MLRDFLHKSGGGDRPYSDVFDREWVAQDMRHGPKRVAVVGLGVAGATAADRLHALGVDVHLYGAGWEVGGRLSTERWGDVTTSRGAMRIPRNHYATRALVDYLGLETRPFVNHNDLAWVSVRGVSCRQCDWSDLAAPYLLSADDVHASVRGRTPSEIYGQLMDTIRAFIPKEDFVGSRQADLGGSERLRELSEVSLLQALLAPPARQASRSESDALNGRKRASRALVEVMGFAAGFHEYLHLSALEMLLEHLEGFGNPGMLEVVGGMDGLVTGLLERVGRERIHLGHQVTGLEITNGGRGVTLRWRTSRAEGFAEFDYVVVAIPAYEVARLAFRPALHPLQREAIANVNYSPAAKTILRYSTRSWELGEDGFAGGLSFHDTGMLVYPSDNAMPDPGHDPRYISGRASQTHGDSDDDAIPEVPAAYVPRSVEVSRQPGTLTIYQWGTAAHDMMHNMGDDGQRERWALEFVERFHGRSAYEGFEGASYVPWPSAFRHDKPGDYLRYERFLHMPWPNNDARESRVVFAGEHIGYPHAWIQAGVISGAAAARSILAAPPSALD